VDTIGLSLGRDRYALFLFSVNLPPVGLELFKWNDLPIIEHFRQCIEQVEHCTAVPVLPLLGIHDVGVLVKQEEGADLFQLEKVTAEVATKISEFCEWRNANSTELSNQCKEFHKRAKERILESLCSAQCRARVENALRTLPGEALYCPPRIFNWSSDLLLPLYEPPRHKDSLFDRNREVVCIAFYRLDMHVLAKCHDQSDGFLSPNVYEKLQSILNEDEDVKQHLRLLFAGLGAYQLIAFLAGACLDDINNVKNKISQTLKVQAPGLCRELHAVATSSAVFSVPGPAIAAGALTEGDVSVLLKIWPGYREDPLIRKYVVELAEATGVIDRNTCPLSCSWLVSGERQGHFDMILTFVGVKCLEPLINYLQVLGMLVPFVEDTATILRFNSNLR